MEKKSTPHLWKKAKNATVSSFISDLSSRGRRSPLVVQTGFPTSLADIIVKNRSRLKKPSSKKKVPITECPWSPPPPPRPSQISGSAESLDALELPLSDERSGSEIGRGESHDSEVCNPDSEDLSRSCSDELNNVSIPGCRWFSAVLMAFLVVILAVVTKEIAVGITAFAFVLFFLEFVVKRWSFPRRKCAVGSDVILVNEFDLGSIDPKRMEVSQDHGDFVEIEEILNEKDCQSNETEVTESPNLDLLMCEWKREVLEVGGDGDSIKIKKDRNRKLANATSVDKFFKKLVPKKYRAPKAEKVCKEKLDSSSEDSELKAGEGEDVQVQEEFHEMEDEEVSSSEFSNETSSLVNSEDMVLARENMCIETTKSKMGHLIIFVIVLLGLVEGRAVALSVTVAWFLVGKSVETGWRNLKKMYGSGGLL